MHAHREPYACTPLKVCKFHLSWSNQGIVHALPFTTLGRLSHGHSRRIIGWKCVEWGVRLDADAIVVVFGVASAERDREKPHYKLLPGSKQQECPNSGCLIW